MIKFFRRIRERLVTERKLSKYLIYAIGEIVLVVIGILIALQINNWNELRKEQLEEGKLVLAIQKGFQFNKKEIEQNIEETYQTVTGSQNVLDLFLVPTEQLTNDRTDSIVRKMLAFSTFHPSDGALNNLISSGKLDIIKNDTLRDHLSNWNSLVIDVTEDEEYLREYFNTYLTPIIIKHLSSAPNSKFYRSSKELFENPEFENIVLKIHRMAEYQVSLYQGLEKEIDLILSMVKTHKTQRND